MASKASESQHAKLITYDGSQCTLWDDFYVDHLDYCTIPAVMNQILPNSKFIVLMRNPAMRLYSNFIYSCSSSYGFSLSQWPTHIRDNLEVLFHHKVNKLIEQFNNCRRGASLFECTNCRGKKMLHGNVEDCSLYLQRLTIGIWLPSLPAGE